MIFILLSGANTFIEKLQQSQEVIKHLIVDSFGDGTEIINQLETIIEQFFGGEIDLNEETIIQQQPALLDEFFG